MPGEPRALTSEVLTEEAKDQVIDDKSRNADKDPEVSEAAVHESEAGAELPVYRGGDLRGLCENSVGKPDAGNRHVRFDERGRETGRIGTAPFLDSTLLQAQETKPFIAMTLYFAAQGFGVASAPDLRHFPRPEIPGTKSAAVYFNVPE